MKHWPLALATVCCIAIAGCTADRGDGPNSESPTAPLAASAAPTTAVSLSPAPSDVLAEDGTPGGQHQVPVWDEASRESASRTAVAAMRAFAQPQLDFDAWYAQLEPYLTQEAAEDYAFTDPANVPVSDVTGEAEIVDDSSAYLAWVAVSTDVGDYTVLLVRGDANSGWTVSKLTPPEGVH